MSGSVLLTDRPCGSDDLETAVRAEAGFRLRRAPDTDPETLANLAEGAEGMLVCYAKVGQPVIEAAKRGGCRVIARYDRLRQHRRRLRHACEDSFPTTAWTRSPTTRLR